MSDQQRIAAALFVLILVILSLSGAAGAQVVESGVPVIVDGNDLIVGPVLDFGKNPSPIEFAVTAVFVDGAPHFVQLFAGLPSLLWQPGLGFEVAFEGSGGQNAAGLPIWLPSK